jgi:phosphotransferase system enzyme I (PtsP)
MALFSRSVEPRRLIARLRDVMAGSGSPEHRLDKIVKLIAAELMAEVCSCYVMRAGEVLELFATIGLAKEAVHQTKLRVGEGLVGSIAAAAVPLALANAPAHPNFVYRPETEEDPFQSLAGVPILRGGKVRGVLVIQNRQRRVYTEEEIETLQTIAMVMAEVITTGELVGPQEISLAGDAGTLPQRLNGIGMNGGIALGTAVLHRQKLTLREIIAEDWNVETRRLDHALETMQREIDALVETSGVIGIGAPSEIMEAYRLFSIDPGWLTRIREVIKQGLTGEAAVMKVQDENRVRIGQIADPYIRERLLDLEDLTSRLLRHLSADGAANQNIAQETLPEDAILVARALGPAELLDYDHSRLKGVVLEEGSSASHVAIVARALGLPLVGRCADALSRIEPMDRLVIDGAGGQVYVRPSDDIIESALASIALRQEMETVYQGLRDLPAVTLDGVTISLMMNAGLPIEMPHLAQTGAEGVGLYRTEIPFMVGAEYPDVKTQTELYRAVLAEAEDKPVVFRTLDVGGDKALPSFAVPGEENPALGWRALRIGLDRPAMLRGQLRALMSAHAGRELIVMLPLVAELAELDQARALIEKEWRQAAAQGNPPTALKLGVMIEAPSILWQLEDLLKDVDFVSIGSNDLMQYMYAADRNNARMGNRYDPLSPPMLRAMAFLARECQKAGKPFSVCGDMASRGLDVMALIGLGFRSFSMPPQTIGPVKLMVRSLEAERIAAYLARELATRDHSLRHKLKAFARDHGILIEGS